MKGLSELHSKDIIHGNIRPRSFYLGNDGHLKLGDLGYIFEPSDSKDVKPEALLYIAPEYFSDNSVKKESDFYSLGLTLFHLYYGRPAFVSVDNDELIQLHKESEISETESSHELQLFVQFLKKMTAVKVEDRYSSVEEALLDLMALVHNKKDLPSSKRKTNSSEEPLSKAWLAGAFVSGAAALVFIVLNILKS